MILDTNAVSDFAKGDPALLRHLRTGRIHSLPAIVLGEYRYGLEGSRSKSALQQWLVQVEGEMEILDVTRTTAHAYAFIRHELRKIGKPIPENDVWIAALAREHGLAILSKDAHFDFIPGIIRIGW